MYRVAEPEREAIGPGPAGGQHVLVRVPLTAQQQVLGALWLVRDAEYALAELHLLSLLAEVAASAMHRSALHEQTARRLSRLQALRAIDVSITSGLDRHAILAVILDQVVGQLEVSAAAIFTLDRESQTLELAATRGLKLPARSNAQLRRGVGFARQVALRRSPIHFAGPVLTGTPAWFGEEGFVAYYGLPLVANGQVKGVLEIFHRAPLNPDEEWLDFLETLAGQAAITVEHTGLFEDLRDSNSQLVLSYDATIAGWSRALDMRDRDTEGHAERVTELTVRLARAMGVPDPELVHIYRGALLHDIGKMGIPDNVLLKPEALTEDEWKIMRQHPANAHALLSPIVHLQPALDIPYCHHERWDGTGYPRGLRETEIPLAARIFAVVDVWDALCSDRPYRSSWPPARVRDYIRAETGSHFDPEVVEAFLRLIDEAGPNEAL